jgi:hypothetical protein
MAQGSGTPSIPVAMGYVAAVTLVVGLALFLLPPYGEMPLSHQVVLTGFALALWSFSDGLFGRFSLILALIEAVLLLRLSIGWTYLFVEAFGAPAEP